MSVFLISSVTVFWQNWCDIVKYLFDSTAFCDSEVFCQGFFNLFGRD